MTALVVGLTVAVILLGFLVAGLLRANAEVVRALHQLGVGPDPAAGGPTPVSLTARPAPGVTGALRPTPTRPDAADVVDLTGTTPAGDAIHRAVTGVAHDTLVAFLTSGCQTCRRFWEAFREPLDVPGGAELVVVTRGREAESPGAIAALAGPTTSVVMSTEAWEHYDIPYAPYFVYLSGPAGRVMGEGVAAGWEEVRTLVANAVADGTTTPAGTPTGGFGAPRSRADQARDLAVDEALRTAGIEPGDPRLYPASINDGGERPR